MQAPIRTWQRMTEAPPAIRDRQERRHIQLLSGLLLLLVVLGFIAISIQHAVLAHFASTFYVTAFGLLILLAAYGLVRLGKYTTAAIIAVAVTGLMCFAIIVLNPQQGAAYAFLALDLLLAFLLLRTRGFIITNIGLILGVSGVMPLLQVPPPDHDRLIVPIFLIMVSALLLLYRHHRSLVEAEQRQQLAETATRYRAFFEQAAVGVAQVETSSGRFLKVNQRYCDITGYSEEEMLAMSFQTITYEEDVAADLAALKALIDGKIRSLSREKRYKRRGGEVVWVVITVSPLWPPGAVPTTHMVVAQDITERKRAEEASRASEARYRTIVETAQEGVWEIDAQGKTTFVNQKMADMLGYRVEEMVGVSLLEFMDEEGRATALRNLERRRLGIAEQHEFKFLCKNGDAIWTLLSTAPMMNSHGEYSGAFAMVTDITERVEAQARLQHMAQHDALTSLPNRSLLLDRFNQAISRAHWRQRIIALLFIDLDRFKHVNDSLGHEIGDVLLQQLATRFARTVREGDTVARFGGDEFVILLDDVANENDIRGITLKILDALAQPFDISGHALYITASIGISMYPDDGEDATALLKNADIAMYRAKELGKNTYQFYSADMSARAFERLTLESSLRRALEGSELRIYYQPVFDLHLDTICGVEALLRWQHPEFGLVLPNDFIPSLEELGLIGSAGEWVLEQACAQLYHWHAAGWKNLRLAVNLSPRQIQSSGLIPILRHCLARFPYRAGDLQLEITETVLMQQSAASAEVLTTLRDLGIRLALDDFGTGYSSLSYLQRFHIDTLKIDRSFVRDVPQDADDSAITTAIVLLAQSLKLEVIAEGVETEAQRDFLLGLGCHQMQGYLFSRPLPAEDIEALLQKQAPAGQQDLH